MPEGYGLYGGKGWSTCARASVNPARGTLRIPSTVAKAVVASIDVCRRIGVPSSPQRSHRFQAPTVTAASHVCLGNRDEGSYRLETRTTTLMVNIPEFRIAGNFAKIESKKLNLNGRKIKYKRLRIAIPDRRR